MSQTTLMNDPDKWLRPTLLPRRLDPEPGWLVMTDDGLCIPNPSFCIVFLFSIAVEYLDILKKYRPTLPTQTSIFLI